MLSVQEQRLAGLSVEGHLTLSATINWHLSARNIDLGALLRVILGPAKVSDQAPLIEALNYLQQAYGDRRRKNGPAAVLHCLRVAAMLARVMRAPTTLDLLGALLHDKEEDLTREELGDTEYDRLQSEFTRVLAKIDQNHRWFLGERIALLWRQPAQSYFEYLGVVLSKVHIMPDLLRCKLADRLDNTMDIAVQRMPTDRNAFFELAFSMMFLPGFEPAPVEGAVVPDVEACVLLVSQLFKNIVLMSMLREQRLDRLDDTTTRLFRALGATSSEQAQWVVTGLLSSPALDWRARRDLLREMMDYCASGGMAAVRSRDKGGLLDGSFLTHFADLDDKARKQRIHSLYDDQLLFIRLLVLYIGMFASFLADPRYYLHGIDQRGLHSVD
ncbi:MAG: hypothetical protein JXP73_09960 [Deltaproteobacteria bacterium]|nr:hypothetical protein [Deltaproteobacteria bacterium]